MLSYEATLAELYALAHRGIEPGLSRVREALRRAGNPERALRAVHVAGTNGKGSVCAMVATGLAAAGRSVGLYTSPHLASFTERVRVLGAPPVEREEIAARWSALRGSIGDLPLTFFEAVTVLALDLFRARSLDAVVLEVGLGGRLDATNVLERPLACAITRIALDHERLLGSDVVTIAREKAGILKPGVPAVIAPQGHDAMHAIEQEAAWVGAPFHHARFRPCDPDAIEVALPSGGAVRLRPRLAGAHQRDNAAVAAAVLDVLGLASAAPAAVETAEWPGRLEALEAAGQAWLFDAAHNPDGCEALAAFLASSPRTRVLLFGAMADKDWRAMLSVLRPHASSLVLAAPSLARAERPSVLRDFAGGHACDDVGDAIERAVAQAAGAQVVVAGSIYLVGDVRARVLGIPRDPPIAM